MCRAPYGRVDWNIKHHFVYLCVISRAPYGRVDWNIIIYRPTVYRDTVAPHTGAWIEIIVSVAINVKILCRAPYGRVDWNNLIIKLFYFHNSRAPYGRVDWNVDFLLSCHNITSSRPIRARGLKFFLEWSFVLSLFGRAPYGRVDWNYWCSSKWW